MQTRHLASQCPDALLPVVAPNRAPAGRSCLRRVFGCDQLQPGAHLLGAVEVLLLLGVGWNFLFIGATTLLTETYAPAEKAKAQGFNDLLVFATVTLSATSSGFLHAGLGWESLNLAVVPLLGAVLLAILWLAIAPVAWRSLSTIVVLP